MGTGRRGDARRRPARLPGGDLPTGVRSGGGEPRPRLRRHRRRRGGGAGGVRRSRWRSGRRPASRRARPAGSSRPRATVPSTGSAARARATRARSRRPCCTRRTRPPRWAPWPTTDSDSCSRVVTPRSHRTRRSRSRCASSPGCRRPRSRVRSWCPSRRWRNASCGPRTRSRPPRSRTASPTTPSSPIGCGPCSPSSTSCSTRATSRPAGDALIRADLCAEAIRLARMLVELMPDEAEAIGLLALLLLTDARRAGAHRRRRRAGPAGRPGPDHLGSRRDRRGSRAGAAVPASEPARSVPDPGRDQRGAHRRGRRRRHRLAPDRGALRPARSRSAPTPVVALNRAIAIGERRRSRRRARAARRAHARRLPPVPRRARRRAGSARSAATTRVTAYDAALALVANDAERALLERRRARTIPEEGTRDG